MIRDRGIGEAASVRLSAAIDLLDLERVSADCQSSSGDSK
jgi:hypothetical protein